MNNKKIGSFIKALLKEHNMTQAELAKRLNISKSAVSQNLSGKSLFDIDNMIKISEIFNVSVDELLNGEINLAGEASSMTRSKVIPPEKNNRRVLVCVVFLLLIFAFHFVTVPYLALQDNFLYKGVFSFAISGLSIVLIYEISKLITRLKSWVILLNQLIVGVAIILWNPISPLFFLSATGGRYLVAGIFSLYFFGLLQYIIIKYK